MAYSSLLIMHLSIQIF